MSRDQGGEVAAQQQEQQQQQQQQQLQQQQRRLLEPPVVLNGEAAPRSHVEMAKFTPDTSVSGEGEDQGSFVSACAEDERVLEEVPIEGADAGAGGPKQKLLDSASPPQPQPQPQPQGEGNFERRRSVKSQVLVAGRSVEVWNDNHLRRLRQLHDVPDNFLEGLRLSAQLPKISKGNAPLFRTDDEEFIVKAMGAADHRSMLDLTEAYVNRCEQGSLLSPIYLHFRFCVDRRRMSKARGQEDEGQDGHEGLKWIAYIAMRNLTPNVGMWRARYDLKGCDDDKTLENEGHRVKAVHKRWWRFWYMKCCWSPERWTYWRSKQDAKCFRLPLPDDQRREVLWMLEGDVRWLRELGLMDYSLLVGVQRFRSQDADELGATQSKASNSSVMPNGRHCWVHSESRTEFDISVMFKSREELERGAQKRIHEDVRGMGLDPLDWEIELVSGVNAVPSTRDMQETLTAGNSTPWPRTCGVRLLKKTRDRPITMVTISIIDFLQTWTIKKRVAMCAKALECNKATIPPDHYGERFAKHFIESIVSDPTLQTEGHQRPDTLPIVKPQTGHWSNPCYG